MRGLKGKVGVIAGAAPGNIGHATATRLAEEGMTVVVADLNEAAAKTVAGEIQAGGREAVARSVDISNEDSYRGLIQFAEATYGRVDGLFNVAADLSPSTVSRDVDVTTVPLELWQRTIDITLTGYMFGIRHALPIMLRQGSGSIVNTMSSAVWLGQTTQVAYQTAKSGLVGLTRHTASVGGQQGVRCNLVSPGVTLTAAALEATSEEWRNEILATVRSPRLGEPEDVAALVAFLFSDDAAYINGQSLLVDGGQNFT